MSFEFWALLYLAAGLLWARWVTLAYLKRKDAVVPWTSFLLVVVLWPLSMLFILVVWAGFVLFHRHRPAEDTEELETSSSAPGPRQ